MKIEYKEQLIECLSRSTNISNNLSIFSIVPPVDSLLIPNEGDSSRPKITPPSTRGFSSSPGILSYLGKNTELFKKEITAATYLKQKKTSILTMAQHLTENIKPSVSPIEYRLNGTWSAVKIYSNPKKIYSILPIENNKEHSISAPPAVLQSSSESSSTPPAVLQSSSESSSTPPAVLQSSSESTNVPPAVLQSSSESTNVPPAVLQSSSESTNVPPAVLQSSSSPFDIIPTTLQIPPALEHDQSLLEYNRFNRKLVNNYYKPDSLEKSRIKNVLFGNLSGSVKNNKYINSQLELIPAFAKGGIIGKKSSTYAPSWASDSPREQAGKNINLAMFNERQNESIIIKPEGKPIPTIGRINNSVGDTSDQVTLLKKDIAKIFQSIISLQTPNTSSPGTPPKYPSNIVRSGPNSAQILIDSFREGCSSMWSIK